MIPLTMDKPNPEAISFDETKGKKTESIISNLLTPHGFNEVMNNSLTNNKLNISERKEITIINSISSDISQLRTTMLDSMLKTLKFNLNRKNSNNKFFEFGKIYEYNKDNLNKESRRLGILFYGDLYGDNWNKTENKEPIIPAIIAKIRYIVPISL